MHFLCEASLPSCDWPSPLLPLSSGLPPPGLYGKHIFLLALELVEQDYSVVVKTQIPQVLTEPDFPQGSVLRGQGLGHAPKAPQVRGDTTVTERPGGRGEAFRGR